jgi:hypothetical protein
MIAAPPRPGRTQPSSALVIAGAAPWSVSASHLRTVQKNILHRHAKKHDSFYRYFFLRMA